MLVALVLLVLLTGLAVLAYAGPLFVVRSVSVAGVTGSRAEEVRRAADVPLGRPLARTDIASAARAAGNLPYVASARVSRRWPSTVRVVVDARTPAALVPVASGGYRIVDTAGVVYAVTPTLLKGVPVVRVPDGDAGQGALKAALAVLRSLPEPVRAGVRGVAAGTPDDVRLQVREPKGKSATVVWGSAERSDRKAAVYAVLRSTPAKVYDLSAPDTPVLR